MIPKGSQRAGGQQLATHLSNDFDNDRVEIAQVRGAVAQDLHGAFAEWSATAQGTRCRKYLYSLSVNPDPEQGPLTREQYLDFIDRAEEKLGLAGQPRALVFHVKHGREHCHAVWSRIDTEKMRAVQLSHDRQKLRTVVLEFARDHGLDLPRGVTRDRARDDTARRPSENLAEKQQEERTGESRDDRIHAVTEAWNASDDGKSLVRALEERGYLLARGDRRGYVVVDRFGEIHALARQIEGVRTKEVKARLKDYPMDQLPDAKKAQEFAREQREDKRGDGGREEEVEARRRALTAAHAKRRARVNKKRETLHRQHQRESKTLRQLQQGENRGVATRREASRGKGILAFLARITGIQIIRDKRANRQDERRAEEHRRQTAALQRRHRREMQDFSRHYRALKKIETRERRSLSTALRREEFTRIAGGPTSPRRPVPPLSPTFADRAARPPEPPEPITPAFREVAAPPETPKHDREGGLSPDFNKEASGASEPDGSRRDDATSLPARDRATGDISQHFNKEASGAPGAENRDQEPTPSPPKSGAEDEDSSLSDAYYRALKERVEKRRQERDRSHDEPDGPDRGPSGP